MLQFLLCLSYSPIFAKTSKVYKQLGPFDFGITEDIKEIKEDIMVSFSQKTFIYIGQFKPDSFTRDGAGI